MRSRKMLAALIVAVIASMSVALGVLAPSGKSITSCSGYGWSTPASTVTPHVTTWCYHINSAQAPIWIAKAPSQYVHSLEQPVGTPGPGNPDPGFTKHSVHDWLTSQGDASIVVNGSFFTTTGGPGTSTMSFPLWNNGGNLQTVGFAGSSDLLWNHRVCVTWAQSFSAAGASTWTYPYNDWTGTQNAGGTQCPQYNTRMVAGDVNFDFAPGRAKTMVGWDASASQLCLIIGVEANQATVNADLQQFNCTPLANLDGGNSSQLSVRDWNNANVIDYWTGDAGTERYRPVPHAIYIN